MKKSGKIIAHESARIDKKQYHSTNPLRLLRSLLTVIFSGGSVMAHGPSYGRRR